jgi:hypothetical protein
VHLLVSEMYTKADISQNKDPLFQRVNNIVCWLCATFTAQFAAVYHLISGTEPLTDQVRESSPLVNWKMSKMLMIERPRHNNANWHITSRRRPQGPASKSKTSLQITAVYLQSQSTGTQVRMYSVTFSWPAIGSSDHYMDTAPSFRQSS